MTLHSEIFRVWRVPKCLKNAEKPELCLAISNSFLNCQISSSSTFTTGLNKNDPFKATSVGGFSSSFIQPNRCLSKLCAFRCLTLLGSTHIFAIKIGNITCYVDQGNKAGFKLACLFVCLFVCCIFTLTARTPILFFPQDFQKVQTIIHFPEVLFKYPWYVRCILCIHLSPIQPSQLSPDRYFRPSLLKRCNSTEKRRVNMLWQNQKLPGLF